MFMIKLAILMLIVWLGFKGLKSWAISNLLAMQRRAEQERGEITDEMVKDPYCKVYFPMRQGVHLRDGGKDLYFCCTECRDNYLKNR